MDAVPSGRLLTGGDYRDLSRSLRRLIKQRGSGNFEAGLIFIKHNLAAQQEVAALVSVDLAVSRPLLSACGDAG